MLLAAAVLALPTTLALGEAVTVDGTGTQFETQIEANVAGKAVKMDLTGAGLRKRVIFKVYAIGSYVEAGTAVRSAEDLIAAECSKQLHLVMARDVGGQEMAENVAKAVRKARGDDAFPAELKSMAETMMTIELKKGDHVRLTSLPKKGLECDVVGKKRVVIENSDFARAIWEVYLGNKNIDDDLKKALVSRL
jgi:hypothetical protein